MPSNAEFIDIFRPLTTIGGRYDDRFLVFSAEAPTVGTAVFVFAEENSAFTTPIAKGIVSSVNQSDVFGSSHNLYIISLRRVTALDVLEASCSVSPSS